MQSTSRSETPATHPCCAPECCSDDTTQSSESMNLNPATMSGDALRNVVRQKYGAIASADHSGCGCSTASLEALGYTADQTGIVPEGADLGLGCGNPLQHAAVRPGETVLDLGSGAGVDAFLAAQDVGPTGRVLGVDMTPAMLDRARSNAERIGARNVEFRLGEIEHLPVSDNTVDAIISNCVINLSPDKPQVFREALRVLRPGGRMVVSDLVILEELPQDIRTSVTAYIGCVAGASSREVYLRQIREAGFERVEVVEEKRYAGVDAATGDDALLRRALDWSSSNVVSMKVRAWKPSSN